MFFVFILAVVGYFFYEARGVLFAPSLEIFEPRDGAILNSTEIHIAGRAGPNSAVWVSGKIFQSDDTGIFEGDLRLVPGYNQIGISVKDRFGSETRKVLRLIVK